MNQTYNKLNNEFQKKRNSLTFNPENLDNLTSDERKSIERKLLRLCKSGTLDCFKYIPYMKYVSPEKEITLEIINTFPTFHQAYICCELYKRTNDMSYYAKAIKCANIDIKSFGLMLKICNETLNQKVKSILKASLTSIAHKSSGEFKIKCEALLNRDMIGDEFNDMNQEPIDTKETTSAHYEMSEIKAYNEKEYLAKLAEKQENPSKKLDDMLNAIKNYEDNGESSPQIKK